MKFLFSICKIFTYVFIMFEMLFVAGCSQSTANTETPQAILTQYLDFVKAKDADHAADFVVDSRRPDKESRVKWLKESIVATKLVNYSIDKGESSTNDKVLIPVSMTIYEAGQQKEVKHTFRLIKTSGQWKVAYPSEE